jgi:hypothetical protein
VVEGGFERDVARQIGIGEEQLSERGQRLLRALRRERFVGHMDAAERLFESGSQARLLQGLPGADKGDLSLAELAGDKAKRRRKVAVAMSWASLRGARCMPTRPAPQTETTASVTSPRLIRLTG